MDASAYVDLTGMRLMWLCCGGSPCLLSGAWRQARMHACVTPTLSPMPPYIAQRKCCCSARDACQQATHAPHACRHVQLPAHRRRPGRPGQAPRTGRDRPQRSHSRRLHSPRPEVHSVQGAQPNGPSQLHALLGVQLPAMTAPLPTPLTKLHPVGAALTGCGCCARTSPSSRLPACSTGHSLPAEEPASWS